MQGDDLVPLNVLDDKDSSVAPDAMRSFTDRYLGVLRAEEQRIDILDLEKGGAVAAKLPLATDGAVQTFCASESYVYLLGNGPRPRMWRIPAPSGLKPTA